MNITQDDRHLLDSIDTLSEHHSALYNGSIVVVGLIYVILYLLDLDGGE